MSQTTNKVTGVPAYLKELAKDIVARATALNLKGKARDRACMDFFCGAIHAYARIEGQEDVVRHLTTVACVLISTRGYSEVERLAQSE